MRVERQYAAELPLVPLDESLCEQAFLNLVQNAYEAMEDNGGTLRVDVHPAEQDGRDGLRVLLADTGPGVAKELQEEIFNPFVTKVIDGHHGSIRVENSPKGGAVFTLFFPLEEIEEELSSEAINTKWKRHNRESEQ